MIVKFFEWHYPEKVLFNLTGVRVGDKVVVQHSWGLLLGTVVAIKADEDENKKQRVGQVLRKATARDLEVSLENQVREAELSKQIKAKIRDSEVVMKVVDVRLSLDAGSIIIAFTADSRVDFRQLVKEISFEFGKAVRFQQVGARDEARRLGGFGICGRELCCVKFSRALVSITTDMARCQSIAHRGSERLSGLCGRLMCCLSYESQQYEESAQGMPQRGDKVYYQGKKMTVIDTLVLDGKVKIVDEARQVLTVKVDELDKIKKTD